MTYEEMLARMAAVEVRAATPTRMLDGFTRPRLPGLAGYERSRLERILDGRL